MKRFQFALCNIKWLVLEVRKSIAEARLRRVEWMLWNDSKGLMEAGITINLNAPHWSVD